MYKILMFKDSSVEKHQNDKKKYLIILEMTPIGKLTRTNTLSLRVRLMQFTNSIRLQRRKLL